MSIAALNWCRDFRTGSPVRKAVLFALCDRADDAWSTFIGQDRIAGECELSVSSVKRAMAELEEMGVISRERRCKGEGAGRGRTSDRTQIHHLDLPVRELRVTEQRSSEQRGRDQRSSVSSNGATKVSESPDQGVTLTGEASVEASVTQEASETTSSPDGDKGDQQQLLQVPDDKTLGFAEFWKAYPARDGKKLYKAKAQAKWVKLNLGDRRAAWRGAGHYAEACAAGVTRPCDAYRWLERAGWADWQTPAQPDVRSNGRVAARQERSRAALDRFVNKGDG